MKTIPPLLLCTFACALFACNKTELNSGNHVTASSLDDQTLGSITSRDMSSFLQPRSDDYASIPQDPNNPLTAEKIELGRLLFHESRLGVVSRLPQGLHTYSCATCHHAEAGFQSGLLQSISEGGSGFGSTGETRIVSAAYLGQLSKVDAPSVRTPTALNSAFQEVMAWSGSMGSSGINAGTEAFWVASNGTDFNFRGFQGVETITLGAIKNHKLTPDTVWLSATQDYKNLFDLAFPDVPENKRVSTVNTALAMAAYQRTLLSNLSPFQLWLQGDTRAMTQDQLAGKNIFFGKGKCAKCHFGPALNSTQFYALAMNDMPGDAGFINVPANNIFNQGRGSFTGRPADMFKFKVPQLYNLKDVQFFGHGGTFSSIEEVVNYKNAGIPQNANVPVSQLAKQFVPLNLTEVEIAKLVIFIRDALYDPNLTRYVPASVPSGNCIPNNDAQSKADRGCQ